MAVSRTLQLVWVYQAVLLEQRRPRAMESASTTSPDAEWVQSTSREPSTAINGLGGLNYKIYRARGWHYCSSHAVQAMYRDLLEDISDSSVLSNIMTDVGGVPTMSRSQIPTSHDSGGQMTGTTADSSPLAKSQIHQLARRSQLKTRPPLQ
ncbi:hypothetical protein PM082_009572 [Marasmius tenuissimus]|nr:hypothetical protein PM082_009572 [Marasmius tenuissimus]